MRKNTTTVPQNNELAAMEALSQDQTRKAQVYATLAVAAAVENLTNVVNAAIMELTSAPPVHSYQQERS